MKKVLLFLIMFFMFNIEVNAATIGTPSMTGTNEVKAGESFKITISVPFNIDEFSEPLVGVVSMGIGIKYDKDIFVLTEASSPDLKTTTFNEDNYIAIVSYLENTLTGPNACDFGLFCGTYKLNLTFFAKDDSPSSTISLVEAGAIFADMETYEDEDDMIEKEISVNINRTIKVNPGTVTNIPNDNIGPNISIPTLPHITTTKSTTSSTTKASNNMITDLAVDGYDIGFDVHKLNYRLTVPEAVNSLNISVKLEDKTAKYNIIGADDLAAHDNTATIEITAQDGSKRTYTIKITHEGKKEEAATTTTAEKKKTSLLATKIPKLPKNIKKYLIIGGIVIGVLIIISFICGRINSHKVDKMFKDL